MQVDKNSVVTFHYTIHSADDTVIETTAGGEPTAVLHGHRNVIVGLEKALAGRETGDTFSATIPAEDAYGNRREDWQERISKKYLPNPKKLRAGMVTQLRTEQGVKPVTVVKVGSKFVDVDLNHPQAGQELTFDIEIVDVREASKEELAHKHAHGPGGHH